MKIAIGGIKFSGELVHILYTTAGETAPPLKAVLAGLAQARINVPFLTVNGSGGEEAVLCVAEADSGAAEAVLHRLLLASTEGQEGLAPDLGKRLAVRHGVGTLTIFPHRRSYTLLGRIVATLHSADITVHSFCTSISALAINIDYSLLSRAVEALDGLLDLPENHAPFHPEFCVAQTAPRLRR